MLNPIMGGWMRCYPLAKSFCADERKSFDWKTLPWTYLQSETGFRESPTTAFYENHKEIKAKVIKKKLLQSEQIFVRPELDLKPPIRELLVRAAKERNVKIYIAPKFEELSREHDFNMNHNWVLYDATCNYTRRRLKPFRLKYEINVLEKMWFFKSSSKCRGPSCAKREDTHRKSEGGGWCSCCVRSQSSKDESNDEPKKCTCLNEAVPNRKTNKKNIKDGQAVSVQQTSKKEIKDDKAAANQKTSKKDIKNDEKNLQSKTSKKVIKDDKAVPSQKTSKNDIRDDNKNVHLKTSKKDIKEDKTVPSRKTSKKGITDDKAVSSQKTFQKEIKDAAPNQKFSRKEIKDDKTAKSQEFSKKDLNNDGKNVQSKSFKKNILEDGKNANHKCSAKDIKNVESKTSEADSKTIVKSILATKVPKRYAGGGLSPDLPQKDAYQRQATNDLMELWTKKNALEMYETDEEESNPKVAPSIKETYHHSEESSLGNSYLHKSVTNKPFFKLGTKAFNSSKPTNPGKDLESLSDNHCRNRNRFNPFFRDKPKKYSYWDSSPDIAEKLPKYERTKDSKRVSYRREYNPDFPQSFNSSISKFAKSDRSKSLLRSKDRQQNVYRYRETSRDFVENLPIYDRARGALSIGHRRESLRRKENPVLYTKNKTYEENNRRPLVAKELDNTGLSKFYVPLETDVETKIQEKKTSNILYKISTTSDIDFGPPEHNSLLNPKAENSCSNINEVQTRAHQSNSVTLKTDQNLNRKKAIYSGISAKSLKDLGVKRKTFRKRAGFSRKSQKNLSVKREKFSEVSRREPQYINLKFFLDRRQSRLRGKESSGAMERSVSWSNEVREQKGKGGRKRYPESRLRRSSYSADRISSGCECRSSRYRQSYGSRDLEKNSFGRNEYDYLGPKISFMDRSETSDEFFKFKINDSREFSSFSRFNNNDKVSHGLSYFMDQNKNGNTAQIYQVSTYREFHTDNGTIFLDKEYSLGTKRSKGGGSLRKKDKEKFPTNPAPPPHCPSNATADKPEARNYVRKLRRALHCKSLCCRSCVKSLSDSILCSPADIANTAQKLKGRRRKRKPKKPKLPRHPNDHKYTVPLDLIFRLHHTMCYKDGGIWVGVGPNYPKSYRVIAKKQLIAIHRAKIRRIQMWGKERPRPKPPLEFYHSKREIKSVNDIRMPHKSCFAEKKPPHFYERPKKKKKQPTEEK